MGLAVKQEGLFKTPEESRPVPEIVELAAAVSARGGGAKPVLPELKQHYGLLQAVLDPYVNAVHVSLLRAKDGLPPASEERFAGLRETLMREGPEALSPPDRLALMLDVDSMNVLHHRLWSSPASDLSGWWRRALKHYDLIATAPETPFSRASVASSLPQPTGGA